jgi:hypothetical protein
VVGAVALVDAGLDFGLRALYRRYTGAFACGVGDREPCIERPAKIYEREKQQQEYREDHRKLDEGLARFGIAKTPKDPFNGPALWLRLRRLDFWVHCLPPSG